MGRPLDARDEANGGAAFAAARQPDPGARHRVSPIAET
jgi:hypothetical protein